MAELKLFGQYAIWRDQVEFFLAEDGRAGRSLATKIEYTEQVEGALLAEPSFVLSISQAQALVNQLWDQGIRPKQSNGSETPALASHLADMRAIAFAKLNIDKPNV